MLGSLGKKALANNARLIAGYMEELATLAEGETDEAKARELVLDANAHMYHLYLLLKIQLEPRGPHTS